MNNTTYFVPLYTRLLFCETWYPSLPSSYQNYGRVGMYESNSVCSFIKLDLSGVLSSDVEGRLFCGQNTILRIPISNHGYVGNVTFFSYQIINGNVVLNTECAFYVDLNTECFDIDINVCSEEDGILYGMLFPNTLSYHSFIHIENTNAELMVSNIVSTFLNMTIINESEYSLNTPLITRYRNDRLCLDVNVSVGGKNLKALFKSNYVFNKPNGSDTYSTKYFGTNMDFPYHEYNFASLSIEVGFIEYAGHQYSNTPVSIPLMKKVLYPLLYSYSSIIPADVCKLKLYYPKKVTQNMSQGDIRVPLIVYIHGGNWNTHLNIYGNFGIEDDIDPYSFEKPCESYFNAPNVTKLLEIGFCVCLIEYKGFNINGNCESMLLDINNALSYLYYNSSILRIDNSKICLWGHSAGAHLALLYGYRSKYFNSAYYIDCLFDIKLIISEAAPTNFNVNPIYCPFDSPSYNPNDNHKNYIWVNNNVVLYSVDREQFPLFQNDEQFIQYSQYMINSAASSLLSLDSSLAPTLFDKSLVSPVSFITFNSPKTFIINSSCDLAVFLCHLDDLAFYLNTSGVPYESVVPICSHNGYSYDVDNNEGTLLTNLLWYKKL